MDIKQNFFTSAKPAPTMPEIQFANDPKFRSSYGQWLSDNFEELVAEFKTHGRFLTLAEIQKQ
jgi:hypothetical protein